MCHFCERVYTLERTGRRTHTCERIERTAAFTRTDAKVKEALAPAGEGSGKNARRNELKSALRPPRANPTGGCGNGRREEPSEFASEQASELKALAELKKLRC